MRGFFITFEGIDSSGKTTQINMLYDYLLSKGFNVVLTREPGGTPLGNAIRDILLNRENKGMSAKAEALLFLASRAELVEKVIIPALNNGSVVICDRFFDSTVVYQGIARSLGVKNIYNMCLWTTSGIKPDKTFLLSINIDESEERMRNNEKVRDRMEIEKEGFKQKIQQGYLNIAKKDKKRIVVIDANKDINSVFSVVKMHVDKLLKIK